MNFKVEENKSTIIFWILNCFKWDLAILISKSSPPMLMACGCGVLKSSRSNFKVCIVLLLVTEEHWWVAKKIKEKSRNHRALLLVLLSNQHSYFQVSQPPLLPQQGVIVVPGIISRWDIYKILRICYSPSGFLSTLLLPSISQPTLGPFDSYYKDLKVAQRVKFNWFLDNQYLYFHT